MNGPNERRIANLIAGLIAKTEDANPGLKWDDAGGDAFELSLTRTTLRIRSKDRDGVYPFIFEIIDEDGRVIESVYRDLQDDSLDLDRLYETASRNNRGVNEKLTELFNELQIADPPYSPPVFGTPPPF